MSTTHAYRSDDPTRLHKVWGGDLTICGMVLDDERWRTLEVNFAPHPVFEPCSRCADTTSAT